jgi:hypothetical protein
MLSSDGEHRFAHLGSHCDSRFAQMVILYAAVEFDLHASAKHLYHLRALPDYHTCVQIMDQAGQVSNAALLDAHRNLAMIVTENFWSTITALASKHQLIAPSVASMISRPRYVLWFDDVSFVLVDGPTQANPYCIRPLHVADIPACHGTAVIRAHELLFDDHTPESTSLAGVLKLTDGQTAWFKPTEELKTEHFLTELNIYQRITAKCEAAAIQPRIPTLRALAVTQNDQSILGILITPIVGRILSDCSQGERRLHRTQWKQQVHEILRFLHDCGVIWGDANETNIMIDEKNEAWVIDFEGGQISADSTSLDAEDKGKDWRDVEIIFTDDRACS